MDIILFIDIDSDSNIVHLSCEPADNKTVDGQAAKNLTRTDAADEAAKPAADRSARSVDVNQAGDAFSDENSAILVTGSSSLR